MEFSCCFNIVFENPPAGPMFVCMTLRGKSLRPGMVVNDVNVVSVNDDFDVRFCKLTSFCTARLNV